MAGSGRRSRHGPDFSLAAADSSTCPSSGKAYAGTAASRATAASRRTMDGAAAGALPLVRAYKYPLKLLTAGPKDRNRYFTTTTALLYGGSRGGGFQEKYWTQNMRKKR
eukprot:scaffold8498_cov28-Tisochrysis_lutea.AAC.1